MAKKEKKAKQEKEESFSERKDLAKLSLYVVICNKGQSGAVTRLLTNCGSVAQFVQRGRGSATIQIRDILGIEDNAKNIIITVFRDEDLENVTKEMKAFLLASRKTGGVGFSIPLSSIIGIRIYSFLADFLRG